MQTPPDNEHGTRSDHAKKGRARLPTSTGGMIVAAVAALWVVLFLILNRQSVTIHFVFFSTRVALFWALALATGAGVLIGLLVARRRRTRA
jgi:uncharacterized integral membrane protein